ncbi:protein piccolo-like [Catharus ustulatus]|uniref:protein piccolo-like n=1 Tax=Catharus ustulatus TaxID=91951 RepID=UPI0014078312|nr:protein piccolo-like [Catharus ustulatus]
MGSPTLFHCARRPPGPHSPGGRKTPRDARGSSSPVLKEPGEAQPGRQEPLGVVPGRVLTAEAKGAAQPHARPPAAAAAGFEDSSCLKECLLKPVFAPKLVQSESVTAKLPVKLLLHLGDKAKLYGSEAVQITARNSNPLPLLYEDCFLPFRLFGLLLTEFSTFLNHILYQTTTI